MVAMSVFFIGSIAANARLASLPPVARASVCGRGAMCRKGPSGPCTSRIGIGLTWYIEAVPELLAHTRTRLGEPPPAGRGPDEQPEFSSAPPALLHRAARHASGRECRHRRGLSRYLLL